MVEPLEELIRWRLWERTGGGLMAELGSHQLDASGIFVSAIAGNSPRKSVAAHVQAVGGRHLLPPHRECEDHVYCMYEFPKPGYCADEQKTQVKDPSKKLVVTYSSINGNGFGDYGEVVMGTKGTLVLLQEQEVMLFKDADTKTNVGVVKAKDGSGPCSIRPKAAAPPRRRQAGVGVRPAQPRLHRGNRALGLVHSQPRSRRICRSAIRKWRWATP